MTGVPRHGNRGVIMIDVSSGANAAATPVSSKASWSYDQSRDFVDVTSFLDDSKASVPGLQNGSGSIAGFWDSSDTTIYNVISSTVERKLYIYPDYTNNATTYIAAKVFFSGKSSGGVTSAVTFDLDFQHSASGGGWIHP